MPVFDYQCEACGKRYDVFHKGREIESDVLCPSCGSTKHKRLMSILNIGKGTNLRSSERPPLPESCRTCRNSDTCDLN